MQLIIPWIFNCLVINIYKKNYHFVRSTTEIHGCNVSISSNRLRLIELTFKVNSRLLRFNLKKSINFNLLPKYQNSKAKTRVAVYNSWPKHDTRHGCEILNSFDVNFHSINLHNQLLKWPRNLAKTDDFT